MLMESTPSLTNWQAVSKLKRPGMHKLSSLQAVAHGSDTVQYFQWRKSRGSSEKFHGAVVDHCGHEHTRVFRDVAEVGRTLRELTDIVGTETDAEVALVFDWDNWWAVKDAQGPRNSGLHYEDTVLQHYRPFWELGAGVDVIGPEADYSKYKLLVAPMWYLISEEAGRRVEQFVANGGTFVATYWSGVVNEHDLCHLGGFPGPLRKTLGIWAEETEGLYEGEVNGLVWGAGNALGLEGSYDAHELCELIHTEGAETLATYRGDFYAGRPALTVNRFGRGKAYYLATRVKDQPFYDRLYAQLVREAGVRRVLDAGLPAGVTAQARTDGSRDYVFVMNFSGDAQQVRLDGRSYTDMESGQPVAGGLELPVNGVRILQRARE
jgi:beta-galactosidase